MYLKRWHMDPRLYGFRREDTVPRGGGEVRQMLTYMINGKGEVYSHFKHNKGQQCLNASLSSNNATVAIS